MARSKLSMETRALTEGAIMAALTAVLALVNIYIPVLGVLVALIWTLPVVSVCVRHGMRAGILTMAAATLIILMTGSPISGLTIVIPCAGPALLLGNAFRKKWTTAPTLLVTTAATFLSMLLSLLLSFAITGITPWQQWLALRDSMMQSVDMIMPIYESSGTLERMGMTAAEFAAQWKTALDLLELLLPALLLVSAAFSALINYLMANKVLTKLKVELPEMVPFRLWRLPWWTIWGFIAGFAMAFLGGRFLPQFPMVSNIGFNILMLYMPILVISGLTVASYYIYRAPKEQRLLYKLVLVGGFILLMSGFMVVMAVIGLFDTVFDYRKLGGSRQKG